MRKYLKFTPIALWIIYFLINFNSSLGLANARLEAITLSMDQTVGGFSPIYYLAAASSFFDEIVFLVVALIAYKLLYKRFGK